MATYPYVCPAGFDCMYSNSCPAFTSPCPTGFSCSSYAGSEYQDIIDVGYAKWKTRLSRPEAIRDVKIASRYIQAQRHIATDCPQGFYCPDAATILPCPANKFCPEGMASPLPCEGLSLCSLRAGYQTNLVNAVIALVLTFVVVGTSFIQNRRQGKAERASHARGERPVEAHAAKQQADTPVKMEPLPTGVPSSETRSDVADPSPAGIGISFSDLDFTVHTPVRKVHILRRVTGSVPPGVFAALMGPTASGKSTLLAALRSAGATATGGSVTLSLDKHRLTGSEIMRRIGYVPQDDIIDRTLTTRELFMFNVRSRLPNLAVDRASAIVQETITDLGLDGCADTVIGGGLNAAANISGGQLKRVNIGCELVSLQRPAALLLDEPTAGLDASIANDLCASLDALTGRGITVLMVVQQPRPEIFARVRCLLLMQAGSVVYEGTAAAAAAYFQRLGYEQNEETSDSDYCIDVLNGLVRCSAAPTLAPGTRSVSLPEAWATEVQGRATNGSPLADSVQGAFAVVNPILALRHGVQSPSLDPYVSTPSTAGAVVGWTDEVRAFLHLTNLHVRRALTTRLRSRRNLLVYAVLHGGMAVGLSTGFTVLIQQTYRNTLDPPVRPLLVGYCPSVLQWYCANNNQLDLGFAQLLFFISSALGAASSLTAVPLFGGMMSVIRREAACGLSPLACALGRMSADILIIGWNASIFAGVWLLFSHSGHWYAWLGVILPTAFAASGVGYAVSVATRPINAAVISIICTTAFCVFSGVEPRLRSVQDLHVLNWVWYLSFATWSAEGTYVTWTSYMRENEEVWARVKDGAGTFGYEVESQTRSVLCLLAIGIGWRLLAAYILYAGAKPSLPASTNVKASGGSAGTKK